MVYETIHGMEEDYFMINSGEVISWPLHVHFCFEIVVVTEGESEFTVGSVRRMMRRNDAVLIFPNQPHEQFTPLHSVHTVLSFSGNLVNCFFKKHEGFVPENNFFTLPEELVSHIEKYRQTDDLCLIKGLLYTLCGLFEMGTQFRPISASLDNHLLLAVLEYVERNYTGACTLEDLAGAMSYDYAYLSKFFVRNIGMTFHEYVNRRRVEEASYLLRTTGRSIAEISAICGFGSVRSFNRNFREIKGLSPREYAEGTTSI